jgi:hypothetical protein
MATDEIEVEVHTKVKLSVELVAQWFANADDDTQARFFVAVCEAAKNWPRNRGVSFSQALQWYQIGSHLRNCECSSEEAREMVREMYAGLETGTH